MDIESLQIGLTVFLIYTIAVSVLLIMSDLIGVFLKKHFGNYISVILTIVTMVSIWI